MGDILFDNKVSGNLSLYHRGKTVTSLQSVPRPHRYDEDPSYDVYLVTAVPLGIVQRTSKPHSDTCPYPRRELRYQTPDGKKYMKLREAANHLLEAHNATP